MKDRILLFNQAGDKVKVFPRHDLFTIEKGVTYMMMGSNDRYLFHYDNYLCFKVNTINPTIHNVMAKPIAILLPHIYRS